MIIAVDLLCHMVFSISVVEEIYFNDVVLFWFVNIVSWVFSVFSASVFPIYVGFFFVHMYILLFSIQFFWDMEETFNMV